MRILIIGAGTVGYTLADQLSREHHDIYVIEQDPELIREMNDSLDVFALCGSGTSQGALEAIGIQDMELVIAVTRSDEVNVLACLMAARYDPEGAARKKFIARVRNPELVAPDSILTKETVGVDLFVNATSIAVDIIANLIEVPCCTDVVTLGDGSVQVRSFELAAGSSLIGQALGELRARLAADAFAILAVTQGGRTFIPLDSTTLAEGDRVLVLLATASLPLFLPLVSSRREETTKVALFGASPAGVQLARRLEGRYEQLLLLEKDQARARAVSDVLKNTVVIHDNALEKGTLDEIGIGTVDVFACLSEKDEDNTMAAMMAKKYGARRTVVLTEKPAYVDILRDSDIDIVINPRLLLVSKILQYLRRGGVISAARLMEGDAEVLEYRVGDDSPLAGKKVGRLVDKGLVPEGSLLACVRDGDALLIPDRDTVVRPGVSVVMFVLPEALEKVQRVFEERKWRLL